MYPRVSWEMVSDLLEPRSTLCGPLIDIRFGVTSPGDAMLLVGVLYIITVWMGTKNAILFSSHVKWAADVRIMAWPCKCLRLSETQTPRMFMCPSGYHGKPVNSFESWTEGMRSQTWRIARVEVLTTVLLKIRVFCDMTICHRATS